LLAGIALAGILVPQGIAYAEIAGGPPQMGLCAAVAGLFGYALFGTSRHLAFSATSSAAAMTAVLVAPMAVGDAVRHLALTSTLAVTGGLLLIVASGLKLGAISEFISKPVLKGFVFGLALTILVKQTPDFIGIPKVTGDFFDQLWRIVTSLRQTNPSTVTVGVAALAMIYVLGVVAPKLPATLVALVLGIAATRVFGLAGRGVKVIGEIQPGRLELHLPRLTRAEVPDLLLGTAGIALVLVAEALVAARTFAAKHRYEIDPDRELAALGVANISAGLLGGMIVGGGMSGTAANEGAGAHSQLSSIVAACFVGLTLAFLLPAIRDLPQAILAAVVIRAVWHLMDTQSLRRYTKLRTGSIWAALAALVGVLVFGILKGLILAVALTLFELVRRLTRHRGSVLGRMPGTNTFVDMTRYSQALPVPGIVIYRPNGVLFFANARRIQNSVREQLSNSKRTRAVVLNLEASPEIDVTSLEMLEDLRIDLLDRSVALYFARVPDEVKDLFARSGYLERLGAGRVFATVDSAVNSILQRTKAGSHAESA
jgi:high affinity sulfate transporter 1